MTNLLTLLAEIRALEEALHRPEIRRSREAVEELLAEGFFEIGASGTVYQRGDMVDHLVREGDNADDWDLHTDAYSLVSISGDAVLLTYRTRRKKSDGSERHVLRSSIWKHTGAKWQMLFHQGTLTKSPAEPLQNALDSGR
ncbi:DUF4440 domain-containing protein [Rhizobium sp. CG5]|uniref:nuclear transport factor 2 family protein n=1 Tax=Rhizobium sp. CG5 TaxID=2726076 RepID=UPI0020339D07|nr:DUF4440 domain-containing protein [Rhizobium sp. CG5]MCM2476860.1 DUF4440 domain-containing protein [Rhizobium sp. CG5]